DPDAKTNWPTKGGRSNTWDFPDEDAKDINKYFARKVMPQVKELLNQYGQVDILWFDTPELIPKWASQELMDTIHKYQPTCIVNNRVGNGLGDYAVYEQSIVKNILPNPWEACVTISANWAYNRHDSAWKSTNVLIRQLATIVSKGGNYLLNLSPRGDGSFAPEAINRVDSVGEWLKVNGDAIYGTTPWLVSEEIDSPQKEQKKVLTAAEKDALDAVNDATSKEINPAIYFTKKGKFVYAIVSNPSSKEVNIKNFTSQKIPNIKSVYLLGKKKKVSFVQNKEGLQLKIPSIKTEIPVYVFKVETY
ncbi:MAG: hypothetical protein DI598_11090, partial [Pseudopedobacter saltans]